MSWVWRSALVLPAMVFIAGCATPLPQDKSLLLPARMSPGAVVLDIFFVRFPFADPDVNERLWDEIDEQQIPLEPRERLARNGFRVGVARTQNPTQLLKLLDVDDKPPPTGYLETVQIKELDVEPRVVRQHVQLPAKQRKEILSSGVYAELPVLLYNGEVSGQIYYQAQGLLALQSFPLRDGRVRLELVPELHHDQPRQHIVTGPGMCKLEMSRPRRVFDEMAITPVLSLGEFLVITCLPNRPGSLGHHFLTRNEDNKEQLLLAIRLSQTQNDGLYDSRVPQDGQPEAISDIPVVSAEAAGRSAQSGEDY